LVYDQVLELATMHQHATPEDFAKAYEQAALKMQIGLGDPGFGPVASLDTERAEVNRRDFIQDAQTGYAAVRASLGQE
ncbi:MAG: hypothetical protein AAFU86_13720, partial [Pseudomonadota bacterium]